ncbi:hypothetical protein D0Y65_053544 [Glycine soja]|nr:hypothetical protein D0Y65_053544 [Glycine soja]
MVLLLIKNLLSEELSSNIDQEDAKSDLFEVQKQNNAFKLVEKIKCFLKQMLQFTLEIVRIGMWPKKVKNNLRYLSYILRWFAKLCTLLQV